MTTAFGKTLNDLRTRRNWTVQELADRAHVSPTLISGLQNHNRQIGENNARKLGVAFGLGGRELEDFVYLAINSCTEKVLEECKAFPAEILNLAARYLNQQGITADQVNRCVLKPKLKDGFEPEAAIFLNDGKTFTVELKVTAR